MHSPEFARATAADDGEITDSHPRTDLDAKQDEVLKLLDELDKRIEAVIREFAPPGAEQGATRLGEPTSAGQGRQAAAA